MTPSDYQGEERSGKPFEARVADAYRALGYQVTPNVQVPGKQTDLLARQEVAGGPPRVTVIECKSGMSTTSNTDVQAFLALMVGHREARRADAGVMVSEAGFSKDARAVVDNVPYVSLFSWDELTSMRFDVKHHAREIVERYVQAPFFSWYVDLAAETLSWTTLAPISEDPLPVSRILADWQSGDPSFRTLFVLADFGAGKTTLLEYLRYQRADAYVDGTDDRVPLLVLLRDYREKRDLTALLRASFSRAYGREISSDALWKQIHAGQFYVLLDGFDEMIERSDARRRTELFHVLAPVLRSASPTVLTSRPSYFVERGEFNGLLATLRAFEDEIVKPNLHKGGASARADKLRRMLVDELREVRPDAAAHDELSSKDVRVIRIRPLDPEQIVKFLEARADDLQAAGASPQAVLDFIERTYDLTDLATRPMLLRMIVESVVKGVIDVNDRDAQLGPSGLYESYTGAKLALDVAKGPTRDSGLPIETRRLLAEALAIEMYRRSTLEAPFDAVLRDVLDQDGPARRAIEESGLSAEEIATDFATCSFVTIDDGVCRFIHKSFRGFFIARVWKEDLIRRGNRLPQDHPLLTDLPEWEILYFLGGFAPTQPVVGQRLWAKFKAAVGDTPLRRNFLTAFLYTRPNHDTRRISEERIGDAVFGRLTFEKARMDVVTWSRCTVAHLQLVASNWTDIQMEAVHLGQLDVHEGNLDVAFEKSTIEALHYTGNTGELFLDETTVHDGTLTAYAGTVYTHASHLHRMAIARSRVRLMPRFSDRGADRPDESLIEDVTIEDSFVNLTFGFRQDLRAARSVLTLSGRQDESLHWRLDRCAVVLASNGRDMPAQAGRHLGDEHSVFLAVDGFVPAVLNSLSCGAFGSLSRSDARQLRQDPRAWGIVNCGAFLTDLGIPRDVPGCRRGRLLLVNDAWYGAAMRPDGQLGAFAELVAFVERFYEPRELPSELPSLLAAARMSYESLMRQHWPVLVV